MIENTSRRGASVHVMGAMSEGPDEYITNMEAAGQRQLVNSSQLPKEAPWSELEALGFVCGDDVEGDDLFVYASIPDGWRKEGTGHSMGSKIVDERGIERVRVFYKAAFYDRHANMHIVHIGRKLASDAVWLDGPVELPECWPLLTGVEKTGYAMALRHDIEHEQEMRQWIAPAAVPASDEKIRRIEAFLALIPAVMTEENQ